MRAALVQARTGLDPAANAAWIAARVREGAAHGASLILTPEMSGLLDRDRARVLVTATTEEADPTLAAAREAAAQAGVDVLIGSLALRPAPAAERLVNRSLLVGPDGGIVARYDKLHLFDVDLPDGQRYRESATYAPGDRAVVADAGDARLGLSICYDLRFPALYAALAGAGAQILAVPSAFTVPTGQAHWHVLLRARAIETGSFVLAPAQSGRHADGRETYGHSLAVSPWGEVLLDMGDEPGVGLVDLDLAAVTDARARIPALAHARPVVMSAP